MKNVDKVKIATSGLRDFNNSQQKFLRAFKAKPLNNSKRDSRYMKSVADDNRRSEQLAAMHRQQSQALKQKRKY
jgi:hypothetical protein